MRVRRSAVSALALSAVMTVVLSPRSLSAQLKYGGYLAVDFAKSEAEGDFPVGTFNRILGGFYASGILAEKFGFMAEMTYTKDAEFGIRQAWVGFLPSDKLAVKAGLYSVPFGSWNVSDRPHEQPLIETPLNLRYLYPAAWRDIGLLVDGRLSIISYAFYLGNGLRESDYISEGQQFEDNNDGKAMGGRLALLLSEAISVGASYYEGDFDDLGERKLKLEGLDLAVVTSQWEIHGEYTKGLIANPDPYERGETEGFSVWTVMSYRKFQPVASYQKMKYNDSFHGDGIATDESRWTLGLRFVLSPAFFLKFEYAWNKEEPKIKNDGFRIQAALAF